jgi:LDH2 family malate/lactate/ureidoglycolate dehydrogenase
MSSCQTADPREIAAIRLQERGMTDRSSMASKLELQEQRTHVSVHDATALVAAILERAGFAPSTALEVAEHLADADLCGVESHGIVRVLQYVEQVQSGYLKADGCPAVKRQPHGGIEVDGGGGIGIPALGMAADEAVELALRKGMAVVPLRNVGHTGRLGAYAERAAEKGCLLLIIGGGGRENWRQVAPFGGRKAVLPTNPYCMGIPGGDRGPVVIDFATSMIAGGWLQSARAAGALVPEGCIIDAAGQPSREPAAYFDGGAILPKGGAMGYGMAVMAEMICEAMLGPASTECNWLVLALDTARYRDRNAMQLGAEAVLTELRACPPAFGFERVQVPGERERELRTLNRERGIALPKKTFEQIQDLARTLGIAP